MATRQLHPSESRGYRELYAMTERLATHWGRLAGRVGDETVALEAGARAAGQLLDDLAERTAPYDLHGFPAARGVGARLADARSGVGDRFLERNQALRLAVLDVLHVKLLVGYLAEIAEQQDDHELAEFCHSWDRRLARIERPVRRAAIEAGRDPDAAVEPLDASVAGRAAHGMAYAAGHVGEWVDRRVARARAK